MHICHRLANQVNRLLRRVRQNPGGRLALRMRNPKVAARAEVDRIRQQDVAGLIEAGGPLKGLGGCQPRVGFARQIDVAQRLRPGRRRRRRLRCRLCGRGRSRPFATGLPPKAEEHRPKNQAMRQAGLTGVPRIAHAPLEETVSAMPSPMHQSPAYCAPAPPHDAARMPRKSNGLKHISTRRSLWRLA
jgi:hypothetical protein